ncbi:MAG: hypothetical protein V3V11_10075, partial [Vicinamibacteria bacterium]
MTTRGVLTTRGVTPAKVGRVSGIAFLLGSLVLLSWAPLAWAVTSEKEENEKKDPPSQEERLAELERQIQLLSEEIEKLKLGAVGEEEREPRKG